LVGLEDTLTKKKRQGLELTLPFLFSFKEFPQSKAYKKYVVAGKRLIVQAKNFIRETIATKKASLRKASPIRGR